MIAEAIYPISDASVIRHESTGSPTWRAKQKGKHPALGVHTAREPYRSSVIASPL
jgi:hypothetical protein